MTKYKYEFTCGFDIIEKGEAEMLYLRRRGLELAKEQGKNVRERIHNELINKWQDVGYYTPDNHYVNSWGDICELDADGRNFWPIGKTK